LAKAVNQKHINEPESNEPQYSEVSKDTIPKMCSQLRLLTHFYQVLHTAFHTL